MIPNKISNQVSPQKISPSQVNGSANSSKTSAGAAGLVSNDDSFKKLLDQTTSEVPKAAVPTTIKAPLVPDEAKVSTEQLKFSGHAIERMKSRGISFGPDELKNIQDAVVKAGNKGSKDTLVLSGESALIVSVKNNTVVTVMDKALMKDNVFTNIDSTIVL